VGNVRSTMSRRQSSRRDPRDLGTEHAQTTPYSRRAGDQSPGCTGISSRLGPSGHHPFSWSRRRVTDEPHRFVDSSSWVSGAVEPVGTAPWG